MCKCCTAHLIPPSREGRLNLVINVRGCCSKGTGFERTVMEKVPGELSERGVTDEEWRYQMEELMKALDGARSICCLTTLNIFTCFSAGLCWYPGFYKKWQEGMKHWQENFNNSVLVPKGMFCKTISSAMQVANGQGSQRVEVSYVAFALSESESEGLKHEHHLQGTYCKCERESVRVI